MKTRDLLSVCAVIATASASSAQLTFFENDGQFDDFSFGNININDIFDVGTATLGTNTITGELNDGADGFTFTTTGISNVSLSGVDFVGADGFVSFGAGITNSPDDLFEGDVAPNTPVVLGTNLAAGDYTFYITDGASGEPYTLTIEVVPAPGAAGLLAIAGAAAMRRRRA